MRRETTYVRESRAMAVNVLRIIRNCRSLVPTPPYPWVAARADTSANAQFVFAGLATIDTGDFHEAENAWDDARSVDDTFAGPVHLVFLRGDHTPLERWSVTDFAIAAAFGPDGVLPAREQTRALHSLVRIVYAYALLHSPCRGAETSWAVYTGDAHPLHAMMEQSLAEKTAVAKQWSHVDCVRIRVDSFRPGSSAPPRSVGSSALVTDRDDSVAGDRVFARNMESYADDMTVVANFADAAENDPSRCAGAHAILEACESLSAN